VAGLNFEKFVAEKKQQALDAQKRAVGKRLSFAEQLKAKTAEAKQKKAEKAAQKSAQKATEKARKEAEKQARAEALAMQRANEQLVSPALLDTYKAAAQQVATANPQYTVAEVARATAAVAAKAVEENKVLSAPVVTPAAPAAPAKSPVAGVAGAGLAAAGLYLLFGL
jgi:hypothetical protein